MGCANSKSTSTGEPDKLVFNAANLDDIDQSTHKKKKNVVIAAAAAEVPADQTNPVAESGSSAVDGTPSPVDTSAAPAAEVTVDTTVAPVVEVVAE
jgi:hypothetical protein